jgi:hypothetical protein
VVNLARKRRRRRRKKFIIPKRNFKVPGVRPQEGQIIKLERTNGEKVQTKILRVLDKRVILEEVPEED